MKNIAVRIASALLYMGFVGLGVSISVAGLQGVVENLSGIPESYTKKEDNTNDESREEQS